MAKSEENGSSGNISQIMERFHRFWPKYVPYCGIFGYFTIATNSLHLPVVQQFLSKDGSYNFTNGCLVLSHAGVAVYIYHRPGFVLYPRKERLLYSLFGSTVFNLSSILSWSVLQVGLPNDEVGKSLVGLACGLTYLYIGCRYLRSVDRFAFRAFRAGQKKLTAEECEEVKEKLERSHLEYEDQELELNLEDEVFSGDGSVSDYNVNVNVGDSN